MEETPEAVDAIVNLLIELEGMDGYPRTEKGLLGHARGVCRIIQDQPHKNLKAMETAKILIDRAIDDFERFPSVRALYDHYYEELRFRPADKGPVDMVEVEWHRAHQEPKWERPKREPEA